MMQSKEEVILKSYKINRSLPTNYIPGELDFCKREFEYETYDVVKLTYSNALVNHKGFLYKTTFSVERKSLLDPDKYVDHFSFKHYLKKVFLKKKSHLLDKAVLCFDEWGNNHYHFFCDTLQRIFAIKDGLAEYTLLLPDSDYMRRIAVDLLQKLDLHPKSVYFIKPKEVLRCTEILLVTHGALAGYTNDALIAAIGESIQKHVSTLNLGVSDKIYVTRRNAKYRKVLNEDEVINTMVKFGYKIVVFEDFSLNEQLEITAKSKVLIGIHGAGLTNMFYLPKSAYVLEFRRGGIYHNQCYWHLADALGLNYLYLFGKPDNENLVIEGVGCNLTIDINKLTETLTTLEKLISIEN